MAGYIRQDTTNNIADGNVINASDFDNEYNAIEAAFHATTGHTHDGTSAEGAPITKIGPTQDVVASASALTPKTDNTVDLGSATLEYKDLYIDGTANIDSLVADTADINAGTIDGVTIGGASAGAGTFTTVAATTGNITTVNATTVDATNIEVTNIKAKDGTASMTLADATGVATFSANPILNAGTANGVLYLNGSKVATSSSAGLTYDGSNLGVGSAAGANARLFAYANDATLPTLVARQDGAAPIQVWQAGGSEVMRFTTGGNLGIGTSSPGYKLQVAGAGTVAEIVASNSAGAERIHLLSRNSAGVSYVQSQNAQLLVGTFDNYAMQFMTNNTARMLLDTSGNLGIGTSSPAYKLDVNGTGGVRFTGSNNNRPVLIDTNVMIKGESGAWAVTHGFIGSSGTNRGGFGALGTDDAVSYYWIGSAYDSNEFVLNGGNLGIGTSSPQTKLNVSDATAATIRVTSVGNANLDLTCKATQVEVGSPNGVPLLFLTSGTERMRLDTSGNLGLGVTPSAWASNYRVLQMRESYATLASDNGNGVAELTSNAYNDGSWRYANSSVGAVRYQADAVSRTHKWFTAPSGTAGNAISFTQAMTLDASGRLGIGTTSPDQLLHIKAATNPVIRLEGASDSGYVDYNGTRLQLSSGGGSMYFVAGNTERARITSGGDLLVGLTSTTFNGTRVEVLADTNQNGVGAKVTQAAYTPLMAWNSSTTGDCSFMYFYTEATITARGSIDYNRAGGLVRYNTTSDYRAKDIIGPVQDPGATIDALKVYEGVMKGATQSRPMLIAHEAQAHAPYAVSGVKDEVNEDGTPKFQQIDVSSLVPLLLAEIQSLRARVAALEAQP